MKIDLTDKSYKDTAFYYDCDNRDIVKYDIPFIVDMAQRYKPRKILELACGTGRVSVPLVKQGFSVVGIDLSEDMLDVFENKIKGFTDEEKNRVKLFKANMIDFEFSEKFDFVIIAFHTFQLLVEESDAKRCLLNIRNNLLTKNGHLFINVFHPLNNMEQTWKPGASFVQYDIYDEEKKCEIQKINRNDVIDTKNQVFYFYHIYNITFEDGEKRRMQDYMGLKYYYYDQIVQLLHDVGFAIKEEYGWYDKSKIKKEREYIFICE